MSVVRASIRVPGRASDAEALWYDPLRWAAWVDGFGHVVRLPDAWPASGRLEWNSRPGGRGRVAEEVLAYEPRTGQTLAIEDERLRGTQKVAFTPASEHVAIALELDYEIKERTPLTWLVDRLFVRRELGASLHRTLSGFARERRGDMELAGEASG